MVKYALGDYSSVGRIRSGFADLNLDDEEVEEMIELIEKLVEMEMDLSITKLDSNVIRVEDFNSINTFEFYINDLDDKVRIKWYLVGWPPKIFYLFHPKKGGLQGSET